MFDKNNFLNYRLPDDFKFGVEIEFGSNSFSDGDVESYEDRKSVKRILEKNKIPCILSIDENNISPTFYTRSRKWIIGRDGSINFNSQLELRSPALKGEDGLTEITNVIKIIRENDFEIDESCGFHVHVSASNLSFKRIRSVLFFYILYENYIDTFSPTRKDTHHSRTLLKIDRNGNESKKEIVLSSLLQCEDQDDLIHFYPDKYRKLNLRSLVEFKTIEFRQFHASFNRYEIRNWIRFINFVIEKSKEYDFSNNKDIQKFERKHELFVSDFDIEKTNQKTTKYGMVI